MIAVSALGAVAGVVGLIGMQHTNASASDIVSIDMLGLDSLRDAETSLIDAGRARANLMLATSDEDAPSAAVADGELTQRP